MFSTYIAGWAVVKFQDIIFMVDDWKTLIMGRNYDYFNPPALDIYDSDRICKVFFFLFFFLPFIPIVFKANFLFWFFI